MALIVYLVAFLEGFTTLSVEIVALRQFTPIIGSSSISTSIILGVILLALSYGYYRGGVLAERGQDIEKTLITNLIFSSVYYFFITFIFYGIFLEGFLGLIGNYFFAILLTSLVLFFIPVFLASQTIPLLSVLLKGKSNGVNIGKLLFYSTIGSFVGSVGTSTVFFSLIGATKTAIISPMLLTICAMLVFTFFYKSGSKILLYISASFFTLYMLFFIINIPASENVIYETANAHHNILIYESPEDNARIFSQNEAYSSGIDIDTKDSLFPYITETRKRVEQLRPKTALVIGAAGFTLPREIAEYDFIETIDVVDVDPDLKDIAEQYFLQEPFSDKINFYGQPSRYFLSSTNKSYDMIFVDVYTGKSLPPQVLTQEFFQSLDNKSENIYLNLVIDVGLESVLSRNIISTIESVFPDVYYRHVNTTQEGLTNFIFTNNKLEGYIKVSEDKGVVYTDDKHSIEYDKFLLEQSLYK